MFYLADYSAIFSCPLCDKTADTVVCDRCYLDVLALLNPLYDGLMTYWFEARSMAVIKIKKALEQGQKWPAIIVGHILSLYGSGDFRFFFKPGEGAEYLAETLNALCSYPANTLIQVDWFDQGTRSGQLNWVMFYG